jgi:hypothetical protein
VAAACWGPRAAAVKVMLQSRLCRSLQVMPACSCTATAAVSIFFACCHCDLVCGQDLLSASDCVLDCPDRSLGDLTAASVGCTSDPEVSYTTLRPNVDHMLVMASDGVWDVLTNEQVSN